MSAPTALLTDHLPARRATDHFFISEQLSDAQHDALRGVCDDESLPLIALWEQAEMPWPLIRPIGELAIVGEGINGYSPGLDPITCALVHTELNRGDGSVGTFLGVHARLAIESIAMVGSEEQKHDWRLEWRD